MSRKTITQVSVLALFVFALFLAPVPAQAGGACGGTYIVDSGDTLSSIASKCGTTVSAITTANPGVADPLKAGQSLKLPSGTNTGSVTSSIVSTDSTGSTTTYVDYTPTYYTTPTYNNGTYVVRYGDTFSAIASRFGLSTYELWGANPQVWNINYLYAGQVLYIPAPGGQTSYTPTYPVMAPTAEPEPLSYGHVPEGTPYSSVRLVNKSSSPDIYVSLQGETRDGIRVIYEYPVGSFLRVKVPTGDYTYVAWVNEQKFVGYFHLGQGTDRTVTFFNQESKAE